MGEVPSSYPADYGLQTTPWILLVRKLIQRGMTARNDGFPDCNIAASISALFAGIQSMFKF